MNKPVIVGMAGGGGSGKTSIAKAIQEMLETQTLLIHLDDWRITDQSNGPFNTSSSNGIRYFDFSHPDSVDVPRVIWLRVLRKITRNQITRGQSFETSIRNHLEGGRVGHLKYIAPTKKFADLIINGEANVDQNCKLMTALICGLMS